MATGEELEELVGKLSEHQHFLSQWITSQKSQYDLLLINTSEQQAKKKELTAELQKQLAIYQERFNSIIFGSTTEGKKISDSDKKQLVIYTIKTIFSIKDVEELNAKLTIKSLSSLSKRITSLATQIETIEAELQAAHQPLKDYETAKLYITQMEPTQLQGALEKLKSDYTSDVHTLQEEVNTLSLQKSKLDQKAIELQNTINRLVNEKDKLQERVNRQKESNFTASKPTYTSTNESGSQWRITHNTRE